MKPVRTRIAPSPTGYLHIGTARTALFNYLFARKHGGVFVVRIEDTDKVRSTPEFEQDILSQLSWLGLTGDEFYRQSERVGEHQKALESLIASGKAYISKEPAKDDPTREVELVRLRNAGLPITFNDVVRGDITMDTKDLGDMIIARSLTDPLYHFAVVVDDEGMGITHVIRGEDHISNTPRQILIQEALGYPRPVYAHLPLILAPDRSKMSKRRHATSVADFAKRGYLVGALTNFLGLLGWNPGNDKELYTLPELVEAFSLEDIQKGGAIFNEEKLRWFNKEYLKHLTDEEFIEYIKPILPNEVPSAIIDRLLPTLRERTELRDAVSQQFETGEYEWAYRTPQIDTEKLLAKGAQKEDTARHLGKILATLDGLSEDECKEPEKIKSYIMPYAEQEGKGAVLWPFRYGITGKERSPDPFTCTVILGKTETLARLRQVLAILG